MSRVEDSVSQKLFSAHLLSLHAKARSESLTPTEREEYERVRNDLARMLVFAQQLVCRPGEKFRHALRVASALDVSVKSTGPSAKGTTLNVSAGGFAANLSTPIEVGANVDVSMALPFGEPVVARAKVVGATPTDTGCRASFAFQELAPRTLDRLEVLVFDGVLPQLSSTLGVPDQDG